MHGFWTHQGRVHVTRACGAATRVRSDAVGFSSLPSGISNRSGANFGRPPTRVHLIINYAVVETRGSGEPLYLKPNITCLFIILFCVRGGAFQTRPRRQKPLLRAVKFTLLGRL